MKEYELDKSTGEVIWTDKEITPQKIKELVSASEMLERILQEHRMREEKK